ncbi:MAG: sirohydrochlorin chelatase, partial [Acidimicrobiales bacterium]
MSEGTPATDVHIGYLELAEPPAGRVLHDLLARGARDIIVVPLMLYSAGHSKSDIPALIADARARFGEARIRYARPLGADYELLRLARRRIAEVHALGLPLAVMARGTSDPDANAEACRIARLVAEMTG